MSPCAVTLNLDTFDTSGDPVPVRPVIDLLAKVQHQFGGRGIRLVRKCENAAGLLHDEPARVTRRCLHHGDGAPELQIWKRGLQRDNLRLAGGGYGRQTQHQEQQGR